MAITLSKEELLKSVAPVQTVSSSSDTFSRLLDLLNNPAIQQIVLRIFNRFLPEPQQQFQQVSNPVQQTNPTNKLNAEAIYSLILNTITTITASKPEMTVSELKTEIEKNKDGIIKLIDNVVKNF
jgi:hypothetical protein